MPAPTSCPALLDLLKRQALLEPAQLHELAKLTTASSTPQSLGKLILDRDWLTSFQVNRVLLGRAEELFLGQYLLQAKLGEGGMGQVFRALDRTMGRIVALKLIRPDVLNSPQAVDRFLKEIRAAAGLDHPNIIRAYHAGCLGSAHFLVMEYAEGSDLHRRLREGHPLPVTSVCDWIRQAALALQHVAERGMVHRDVKPMNLLLTVKGAVKLLDMGLARSRSLAGSVEASHATRQGYMMGTPDYVAPEQIVDASSVDIRADIYSLGCTLHQLLAGSPPFPSNDLRDKFRRHLGEKAERLDRLRPDVPSALANLVRKMMRKEPGERPQTPGEVATALESFTGVKSDSNSVTESIPPNFAHSTPATIAYVKLDSPGRRVAWWMGGGLLAATLALLLLWNPFSGTDNKQRQLPKPDVGKEQAHNKKEAPPDVPLPPKDPPEVPRPNLPLPVPPREPPPWKERLPWQPAELVQVIGDERGRHWGPVSLVAWSGDGHRLASSGTDGIRIWDAATLREVCALKDGQMQATVIALSLDGKRLVSVSYSSDGQIWDISGPVPRKEGPLKTAGALRGNSLTALEFSPDGMALTGLTARGGMVRWLTKRLDSQPDEVVPPGTQLNMRNQALNHKATRLARLDADLTRTKILLQNIADAARKEHTVAEFLGYGRSLALSPNGRILAATVGPDHKDRTQGSSSLRLWDVDQDPPTEYGRYNRTTGGMGLLTFSADGTRLAGATGGSILVWQITEKGPSDPLELKGHAGPLLALAFSPSGNVLVSGGSDGSVRLWDVNKPAPEPDSAGWKAYDLAFSPDGKQLASALRTISTRTNTDLNSRIRIQSLDAPGDSREADFQGFLHSVIFSPDGTRLVTCGTSSQKRESKKQIRGVLEVRDARTLKILHEEGFEEDVFQAHFHDNGKRCTFLTIYNYRSANSRVVFRQFDTAMWKELGNGRRSTAFGAASPDGKLGMTRETGNEPGVGKTDVAVIWDLRRLADDAMPESKRFTLGHWGGGWDHLQDFSPDGSRLAVVSQGREIEIWDPVKGQRLSSSKKNYGKVSNLVFSPNGSLIATIDDEKRLSVWLTDTEGAILKALREPWNFPGTINGLAFDPSGHFLALANANGTIYLLRIRDAVP